MYHSKEKKCKSVGTVLIMLCCLICVIVGVYVGKLLFEPEMHSMNLLIWHYEPSDQQHQLIIEEGAWHVVPNFKNDLRRTKYYSCQLMLTS
jgi:hypothetical protein